MRPGAAARRIAGERARFRRSGSKVVLLSAALLLGSCGDSREVGTRIEAAPGTMPRAAGAYPLTTLDDAGRQVVFSAPPERIVSLVPSGTSILLALGQAGRIVGRTDFDTESAVAALPSVGGGLGSSIETIVSLRPDLVVRFDAGSDAATPRQLDAAGIRHLAIRPDGIGDVMRIIDLLGQAVNRMETADSLRLALAGQLDDVERRVAGVPRTRVAILGGNPPLAAGSGTFLHELVELAGGSNVFADAGTLYAPVSVEAVLDRNPELILVSDGTPLPEALRGLPRKPLPPEVEIPGLGLGVSAQIVAGLLHPELFP